MMFKHSSQSHSKFILKSASFLIILLITFSQYSINSDLNNTEKKLDAISRIKYDNFDHSSLNTPQSAADQLTFENNYLEVIIDEKGNIYYDSQDIYYHNLWYNGYYHDYYSMFYLSIDDGDVWAFEDFTPIKSLTNLTDFTNGGFTRQLAAESIIQHPEDNVFVKTQVKLYPDEEFFVMTFMVWSDSIDIDKVELFIYDDVDIDSSYNDDDSLYSSTTELICGNDKSSDTHLGWVSPHAINSWDMGIYTEIKPNIIDDALTETSSLNLQDISLVTKYQRILLNANNTWTVPIVYGFGTSYSHLITNTVDVKNEFIDDFSVLDFTANLTDNPSVNATILNGGQNELTRNISVFRNGTYLQSKEITLSPGELGDITIDNLYLNSGEYNEITVSVNSSVNDYEPNNNISHTYMYQERLRINFKDLDGFDVEGLNVSLYHNVTKELIVSTFTDEFGNATFIDLQDGDYTLNASAPWVNNQLIHQENFTFPDVGKFYEIQTNLTTLVLHIEDVEFNSVKNASIEISKDLIPDVIWSGVTDQNGNITFQFLNQTYDINVTYYDYETTLILEQISDLSLLARNYYTHQVSLTNLTFHLKTSGDPPEDLVGAKLEFYERINDTSYGYPIGFEIADSIGNVSIRWSSQINYSIRVLFFSEYMPVGDTEADALNFTESPYNSYEYLDFNVSLQGKTLDQYSTDIVLFESITNSYTWEENIDFKFMFNVSGPGVEGPKWANETFITIKNQDFEIVYNGNATIISGEQGNHSFILNTSSGYFTSGNPEIYTVNVFAQIYGYSNPTPELFSFSIKNITTYMDLNSSSATLYWKDNFTISTSYYDTGGNPIKDGNATVSWGTYLIDYPMQNQEDGNYTIEIDTSLGAPGNYVVNVECFRENYNADNMKFYLNVEEIPTTVNGSILFDSRHSQYVTTQNLTLEYNFTDSYRNISIPDLSPMYQLISSETDEKYTGYLTYSESGVYTFDPKSALLPIGTYHGLIDFSIDNYHSSYASVQYEIFPIPTSLNDTTIPEIPYELNCYSSFILDLQYLNMFEVGPVTQANATYNVMDYYSNENYTGELNEISDGLYRFDPKTENLPIGTYSVDLFFEKENYTRSQTSFTLEILSIPTSLNDTTIPEIPYELNCYSSFILDLQYQNMFEVGPVTQANATYNVMDYYSNENFTGELNEISDGLYRFDPKTENLPIGTYSVDLFFEKENYTRSQTSFTFNINEIPLLLTFEGGSSEDESKLITSTEYTIVRGELFYFSINILDIYEDPVNDCNISYQLTMDSQVWKGYLQTDNMGHYFGNFSEFAEVGLYSLSLTVYKANYTIETLQVHINVEYPEIFGISLPYVLIGALITLIAISAVSGYVAIKRMRIPRYIKDLTKLEKILKNPKNILPDGYPSRIEQLKGKYGNRWEQIDLEFPLLPQIDEIKNFINAYQDITGKLFLKEEAKQFLDDLVIYSEDEIKRRLEAEKIFGENLTRLMEIILNYIQVTGTQQDLEFDSSKAVDDFDLEFGDDK